MISSLKEGRVGDLVEVELVPTGACEKGRIEHIRPGGGFIIRTILTKDGLVVNDLGESTHGFFRVTNHWPENNLTDQRSPEYLRNVIQR